MWMLGQGSLWSKEWSQVSYSPPTTPFPQFSTQALVEMTTWEAKHLLKMRYAEMKTKLVFIFLQHVKSSQYSSYSIRPSQIHESRNGWRGRKKRRERCWGKICRLSCKGGSSKTRAKSDKRAGMPASFHDRGNCCISGSQARPWIVKLLLYLVGHSIRYPYSFSTVCYGIVNMISGGLSLQQLEGGFWFPGQRLKSGPGSESTESQPPDHQGPVANDKALAHQLCRNKFPQRDRKKWNK